MKEEITPYIHHAQYYETDRMGIIHHSNYIRWMEEARIDFLSKIGYSYSRMENEGITSPVISVSCEYKSTVRFGEAVEIKTSLTEYNGVKMKLRYVMTNLTDGKICTLAESTHCFLESDGKVAILKRSRPEIHKILSGNIVPVKHT